MKFSTNTGGLVVTILALVSTGMALKNLFVMLKAMHMAKMFKETALAVSAADVATNKLSLSMARLQLIIGAIMLVITAIVMWANAHSAAMEEEAKRSMELVDATDKEIESLQALKAEYISIYNTENKSESQISRLADIRKELILTYGDEAAALDLLNGKYEENTEKLNKLELAVLSRQRQEVQNALQAELATMSAGNIIKLAGRTSGNYQKTAAINDILSMSSADIAARKQSYQSAYDELLDKQISQGGQLTGKDKANLEYYKGVLSSWEETYADIITLAKKNDEIVASTEFLTSGLSNEIDKLQNEIQTFLKSSSEEEQIANYQKIEDWITRLKTDYSELYKSNKDYIDSITASFEEQVETLKTTDYMINALEDKLSALKEYQSTLKEEKETQEKLLKIEQARAALAEAQRKKTQIFRAGKGFVYEQDTSAIEEAQTNLQSAIDDAGLDNLSVAIAGLSEVQEYYDQAIIDQSDAGNNDLREYFMDAQKVQEFLALSITGMKEFLSKYITTPEIKSTIPNIPKNATGTYGFQGGASIVGENGPEIVNLPKGSGVIPNSDTMKLMSIANSPAQYLKGTNSTSGDTYSFSIDKVVYDGNDYKGFVDQIIGVAQNYKLRTT